MDESPLTLDELQRTLFPTRAIALLLLIGFVDLVMTAVLHANGQIVEMNPVMKVFIERSEWLFVLVKSTTLVLGWFAMVWYCRFNRDFVRKAACIGSGLYLVIWTVWFTFGKA